MTILLLAVINSKFWFWFTSVQHMRKEIYILNIWVLSHIWSTYVQTGYFGASIIVSWGTSKYTRLEHFFFFLPHNESAHLCVCGQQVCFLTEQRFNWSCWNIVCNPVCSVWLVWFRPYKINSVISRHRGCKLKWVELQMYLLKKRVTVGKKTNAASKLLHNILTEMLARETFRIWTSQPVSEFLLRSPKLKVSLLPLLANEQE